MQQEYETMAAEDSYNNFLQAHPDFKEDQALRSEVQHLLEGNEALDLETAYWAARGRRPSCSGRRTPPARRPSAPPGSRPP